MRAEVPQRVPDAQRAARTLKAIDGLEADLRELRDSVEALARNLRELNARPDASRGEFDALLARFEARQIGRAHV